MNINHNLTESDFDKIDIKSPLEHQIQQQEMKYSGWRFDKINSMVVFFYKTGEMNGLSYVKIPLRSSPTLNIENNDKFCFLWSILAHLQPYNINHPNRVSNYKQYFNELNIDGFHFTNEFKCSDIHKIQKINNFSINVFELNFYQDQNKWRQTLVPIGVSKNESDRVIDLAIFKNHHVLIRKLNHKTFIRRRCLNSNTSEKMLKLQKPKSENNDITTIRTSQKSHLHWQKHLHKYPIYFRKYADFETDNEIGKSNLGNNKLLFINKIQY